MAVYGYARVSTTDQDLSIQEAALKAAGCTVIRSEKVSGTSLAGRTELITLLTFLRDGDILICTRLDRLGRSIKDVANIVHDLKARGVDLRCTEQPVDTSSAAGEAFIGMLSVFSQFETQLRKERQMEGIAKAKAEGIYKGRPVSIDGERIRLMASSGVGASAIAKELGIGRASVYRHLP